MWKRPPSLAFDIVGVKERAVRGHDGRGRCAEGGGAAVSPEPDAPKNTKISKPSPKNQDELKEASDIEYSCRRGANSAKKKRRGNGEGMAAYQGKTRLE